MTYGFYVNGKKRLPGKEEKEELMTRMLKCLGYEKKEAQMTPNHIRFEAYGIKAERK